MCHFRYWFSRQQFLFGFEHLFYGERKGYATFYFGPFRLTWYRAASC